MPKLQFPSLLCRVSRRRPPARVRALGRRLGVLVALCAACAPDSAAQPAQLGPVSGDFLLSQLARRGGAAGSEVVPPAAAGGARAYSGIYDDADKWLCRPGLADNPCAAPLTVTEFLPDGTTRKTELPATADDAPADCFFAYATVDPGLLTPPRNLDFPDIDRASVTELVYGQARPFRELCNIYAPLYRQASLNTYQADDQTRQTRLDYAYSDIAEAFDYMLSHSAPDRPLVMLSHSQGSHHTIRLLQRRFETDPALHKRLVVAVLAGPLGGFWVPRGAAVGGSLAQIPLCTSDEQTGCVLTFNTYLESNPPDQRYGTIAHALPQGDNDVGCNPGFYTQDAVRLRGAIFVTRSPSPLSLLTLNFGLRQVDTDYARYADFYSARCQPADNGLTYLGLVIDPAPGDRRRNPVLFDSIVLSDPSTGLHVLDYAFVSGDLVAAAATKLAAHAARTGMPLGAAGSAFAAERSAPACARPAPTDPTKIECARPRRG